MADGHACGRASPPALRLPKQALARRRRARSPPHGARTLVSDEFTSHLLLGAPALYRMVTERTGEGSRWLPSMMPDGAYRGPAAVFRLVPPNNASRKLGGGVIRRGAEG